MSLLRLVKKDLKIVLSDKKAFVILIAMPIILFTILSFALAGSFTDTSDDIWKVDIGIVKLYDIDQEISSSEYFNREDLEALEQVLFDVLDYEDLDFMAYQIMSYDQAMQALENNELASVVVLPEHYLANLAMNMSPMFRVPVEIEIFRNPERTYSSDITENIVGQVMKQLNQIMITNKVTYETLKYYDFDQEMIDVVLENFMNQEFDPVQVNIENYKIDELKMVSSGQYYSTAMMAMFLLFGASYGAKFMLLEKKEFTLQRQKTAGVSDVKIVIGKLVLIYLIALMQITIMILTSTLGFKVYWGEPIAVVWVTLLVAFAITGFGAILAAISLKMDNLKAINIMESGIFQVIALFGGSYFPLFFMPVWFQVISKILINGAALDAYQKVMMDAPAKEIMPAMLSLILNAIVFFIIGLLIINRQPKNTLPKKEVAV